MADYAIGDIQGCFDHFIALIKKLDIQWDKDRLFICGDIVNRGPNSLNTLRYCYAHKDNIQIVLGNHDLHLLAVAEGAHELRRKDTFDELLQPEFHYLIEWLAHQPLAFYEEKYQTLMVHAGVPNHWNLEDVLTRAQDVETVLQHHEKRKKFLRKMYNNEPRFWDDSHKKQAKLRYITNALTRIRYCDELGGLDLTCKVAPYMKPKGLYPWFSLPLSLESHIRIVFGHWASLDGDLSNERFEALDTGCVWGGLLTALNLETGERISVG